MVAGRGRRGARPVAELGLLVVRDGIVVAVSPHLALGRLADLEARTLLERERALDALRGAISDYAAEERGGDLTQSRLQPVEVHTGRDVGAVVDALIRSTTGELLLMYTTEWLDNPGSAKGDTLLARETAGGRPVRSIYPAEALHRPAALDLVRQWAEVGEEVRLLPSPPTRLIVFGGQAALMPVEWGRVPTRRVVVRTPGVVEAMRHLFDVLWRQAVPLPGSDTPGVGSGNRCCACSPRARRTRPSPANSGSPCGRFAAGSPICWGSWTPPLAFRPASRRHGGSWCDPMPAIVLVGAQWGDEGKGKATDLLGAAGSTTSSSSTAATTPATRW